MLTWIIVILLVLWLLGYFGPNVFAGFPRSGNVIHVLLVIVVILIIFKLLGLL
ncbi:MAG: lmo0937 family membrane protein [Anaerolineales bacterium]|nr:lmo0937 family membrane protein [Anaerolineales bacterium]MBP6211125.1 lmo0937 family membrane protein [Anaerolineales bacterium]